MFAQSCKRPRQSELLIEREAHSDREAKKHRPLSWQAARRVPETSTELDQTLRFRAPALTPVDSSDEEGDGAKAASRDAVYKSVSASTPLVQPPRPPELQLNPAHSLADTKLPPLVNRDTLSPWPSSAHSHGIVQPSPIPQNLVDQSLNISGEPSAVPSHGYFPTATQPLNEPDTSNSMDGVAFHRNEQQPTIAVRLPSPISEDDAIMTSSGKTPPSDADMASNSPYTSSPVPSATPAVQSSMSSNHPSANSLKPSSASAAAAAPCKKPALVMGYRTDCDKCRRRVPGHYSHIIRP